MNNKLQAALLCALLLLSTLGLARAGKFDEPESDSLLSGVKFSGLVDLRAYRTDRNVSWLKGGYNPLRYGGIDSNGGSDGDRFSSGFSIPQASLVVDAQAPLNTTVHVQGNYSTDGTPGTSRFGIVEAYAQMERRLDKDAFRLRGGDFIPPLSWEHPDVAWSTRYTITPSPLGSWVGEEVRTLGAEGVWERELVPATRARLTAGLFSGGDHIGYVMWLRGWTFDDFQGDLAQQYKYAGQTITPSDELDGRLGYYGRADLSLLDRAVEFGGGYWTNDANERLGKRMPPFSNYLTQPFRTSLVHYGGKVEYGRWTVISQYSKIIISSLDYPAQDFNSAYVLGSVELGQARLTLRYDRFWVFHPDPAFPKQENGHAFTVFAGWNFTVRQQLGLEYLHVNARPNFKEAPLAVVDRLVQLNYRLKF